MSPSGDSRAPGARRRLFVLVAVTATGPLALNIFVPSLPGLQAAFDADYGTVQLVLSLYLVGIAAGQLIYGPLSDRFGRRPTLLAGLGVYLAGSAACLVAPTIETLIAGRVVQAIGGCAGGVIARAVIADVYEREEAASTLAYVIMAMVVVPMVAPGIGGVLDGWRGWSTSFVVVLAFGIAALVAAYLWLVETHHERTAAVGVAGAFSDATALLGNTAFLGHALQVAFTTSVFFAFLAGAPYVMVELLGRSPAEYGLFFIIVSSTFMLGNFVSGRLSRRLGTARMVRAGTTIALAATVGMLAVELTVGLSALTLFGLMGVVGIGNGLSVSNGLAAAVSVDRTRIGAASGLSGFLQMGMGAAASFVVGKAMAGSALPLLAIMLASAVLALASGMLGLLSRAPAARGSSGR